MAMNFTLFGYGKAGKTTVFNVLTGARAGTSSFEAGKRNPHERRSPVPDARLDLIAGLYPDKKRVAAAVDFVDLAGVSTGEVKEPVFLGALRKADIPVHVVRGFPAAEIPQAKPVIDPAGDISAMEDELLLADLVGIEQRLEKLDKDLKKAKNPEGEKEREILLRLKSHLDGGSALRDFPWTEAEEKLTRAFAFLSQKPLLHIVNVGEADIPMISAIEKALARRSPQSKVLAACGRIEAEIQDIEDPGDKAVFLSEYGLTETTPTRFFAAAVGLMNIVFFYTIGKDEVRAWPLRRNSTALAAAGTIHSDIEKGFIRAEVVPCDELFRHGSWSQAKDKGSFRLEGKEYVVQDGDAVFFRFSP